MFSRNLEMWMMLRVSVTKNNLVAAAAIVVLAACSKQPETSSAPTTPLVEQSAIDPKASRIDEFEGEFAPGGIATRYRATFSDGQIKSLAETRESNGQTGVYEFNGARLMKYQGAALSSTQTLELEFDQQGKVVINRAGDKEASAEEISAIRDRAQSLRSHAVAHHEIRGHGKP